MVLHVELLAKDPKTQQPIWRKSYAMDAFGNDQGSAMARLVSTTVSLAIEAVLEGSIGVGARAAPNDAAPSELVVKVFKRPPRHH